LTASARRSGRGPDSAVRTLRLAHRGDARIAPENSLEALVLATGIPGCDGVELDVRLSRDGIPVLLHDATLERVQGHPGAVRELDVAALRAFGVPSLADVLVALPDDAFLDIELKGEGHGAATAGVLRQALGRAPDRAVISSFDPGTLAGMHRRLSRWDRWLNVDDLDSAALTTASGLGCSAVSCGWRSVTGARVRRARAAGLGVAAWPVRRARTFDRLEAMGVVACCVEGEALDAGATG
jgi:glycerophosphoryl diester phosphodiesterase